MVVYSHYPRDQRVRREAEALKENGAVVDVICLRNKNEMGYSIHNNISVYRIPMELKRNVGFFSYIARYFVFLISSAALLTGLFIMRRYKIIHVHSIPDYEVFCALIPKIFGVKIILDLHELMPEIFSTKFNLPAKSRKVHLAKTLENISVRFADYVITTSDLRKKILQNRTKKNTVTVIMNLPKKTVYKSKDMVDFIEKNNLGQSFIIIYVGGLYKERELDIVIRAIKNIEIKIPHIFFIICGTGDYEYIASLKNMILKLNLDKKVLLLGYVPQKDVLNYIALSNVTIAPYKFHPNLGTVLDGISSTKVFEYLLVPKPVIVSTLSSHNNEFENLISFYKSGDYKDLGEKILEIYENEEEFKNIANKAQKLMFTKYNPKKNEQKLIDIYKKLIA
jgi:glycosyltransferase involved in cell wall biosynthesis